MDDERLPDDASEPDASGPDDPDLLLQDEIMAVADGRLTRRLALGALVLALAAVGLTAWRLLSPGVASCQSTAWSAAPSIADLPAGWSVGATQFDADRLSVTLLGPPPADQTTARAVVYATATCYAHDAAVAMTKSQAAAATGGQTVVSRTDLGDQGYTALDPSGASFIQFRHGDVVTYVAASGAATAAEVETVASAFDRALRGVGSAAAAATPTASSGGSPLPSPAASAASSASAEPSPSQGATAPELEAALPRTVAGTALTIESAVGTSVLGTTVSSRALTAALTAAGRTADDFRIAQAYDVNGTLDLSILAFRVVGMKGDALRAIVLGTWLSATGPGVTTSPVTLGGRAFTRVDYGDGGSLSYVIAVGDIVIAIGTSNAGLAAQAAAALP
jgi:hypothetical protein